MSDIDSMPGKLDALAGRVGAIEGTLSDFARSLDDNTTITRGIARKLDTSLPVLDEIASEYRKVYVPVKNTGSVLTKVATWAGKIALAATAIGAAMAAALHLGGGKQ